MASPSPPTIANPYQEGCLIFTMTTPPERANKLSPRWKGPFRVCRIPNDFKQFTKTEMYGELFTSTMPNQQNSRPTTYQSL